MQVIKNDNLKKIIEAINSKGKKNLQTMVEAIKEKEKTKKKKSFKAMRERNAILKSRQIGRTYSVMKDAFNKMDFKVTVEPFVNTDPADEKKARLLNEIWSTYYDKTAYSDSPMQKILKDRYMGEF